MVCYIRQAVTYVEGGENVEEVVGNLPMKIRIVVGSEVRIYKLPNRLPEFPR